ncbi:Phosphatidylglycerophosphate synthase [hydrothermal vent metagenome]|uniref:Phosphatidylglycerophosphate synthase n=1 Tax=hydrothermal vent metagenome TaxID=652676 RepID=A0A3B0RWS8_9ZZZZ
MSKNRSEHNAPPEQYGRPLSIEDYSNRYVVHPLSDLVVKIALPLKISANAVSVTGLLCGMLAGWFYFRQSNLIFIFAAFGLMLVWHILDGADGRIARATQTCSPLGRIIDGVCDHLVFASAYLGFAFYLLLLGGSQWIWLLGIVAAASHAFQAAAYEERRQKYHRRTRGLVRKKIAANLTQIDGKKSALAKAYDILQKLSASRTSKLDTLLASPKIASDPKTVASLVKQTVPVVRAWALLNANNRTIMLAVFALLGKPALYFWYEIIILNLLFAGLIIFEKIRENSIVTKFTSQLDQS